MKMPTLVLALGGVLFNSNDTIKVFKHICEGLSPEDLFIVSNSLDNPKSPINFSTFTIPEIHDLDTRIARLLFTKDLTENELIFNEQNRYREFNLVLKKDIDLHLKKLNHIVKLNKYDRINIWRHKKDTFDSINRVATALNIQLKVIIKHPIFNNVMYIMGKH